MEHELFRYLSPGICFISPIYLAACWAVLNSERGNSLREFILIGGAATVPALAIPCGWYIYNAFRAFRHITTTSYEEKPFVKVIRDNLKTVYDSKNICYYVDFACINKEIGWRRLSEAAFFIIFHPFKKGRSVRLRELRRGKCTLGYLEPVSDLLLWTSSTYDYARSISSVRYGIDSSIFALLFGLLLGASSLGVLSHFVNDPPFILMKRISLYFWVLFFFVPFGLLIALVVLRRKQAASEYSSRLTLITMVSSDAARANTLASDNDLPADVLKAISQIPTTTGNSYAAFDLDNTLLIGDIGEAVFAKLLVKRRLLKPSWRSYQQKMTEDRKEAYVSIVEAMRGLSLEEIIDATHEVLSSSDSFISVEGNSVPIPRPDPLMQSLVVSLQLRGIDVFVVTASTQIAAQVAAWRLFGIQSDHVLGIRSSISGEGSKDAVLGSVKPPIPFAEGKVEMLRNEIGPARPYLTAGDSAQDIPLLQYTSGDGIIIWVDSSSSEFEQLRQGVFKDRQAILIKRGLRQ